MGNVNAPQKPGCEWGREGIGGARHIHKGQQKGEKARAEQRGAEGESRRKEGRERERERGREEPLFVTVSGLSRSIISRKVLLTALIFRLFLPLPCCSSFPFRFCRCYLFCF